MLTWERCKWKLGPINSIHCFFSCIFASIFDSRWSFSTQRFRLISGGYLSKHQYTSYVKLYNIDIVILVCLYSIEYFHLSMFISIHTHKHTRCTRNMSEKILFPNSDELRKIQDSHWHKWSQKLDLSTNMISKVGRLGIQI